MWPISLLLVQPLSATNGRGKGWEESGLTELTRTRDKELYLMVGVPGAWAHQILILFLEATARCIILLHFTDLSKSLASD